MSSWKTTEVPFDDDAWEELQWSHDDVVVENASCRQQ